MCRNLTVLGMAIRKEWKRGSGRKEKKLITEVAGSICIDLLPMQWIALVFCNSYMGSHWSQSACACSKTHLVLSVLLYLHLCISVSSKELAGVLDVSGSAV